MGGQGLYIDLSFEKNFEKNRTGFRKNGTLGVWGTIERTYSICQMCINAFLARIVVGAWMEAPHYSLHPSPGAKEAHRIRRIQPMTPSSYGLTNHRQEMIIISSSKVRRPLPRLQTLDEV